MELEVSHRVTPNCMEPKSRTPCDAKLHEKFRVTRGQKAYRARHGVPLGDRHPLVGVALQKTRVSSLTHTDRGLDTLIHQSTLQPRHLDYTPQVQTANKHAHAL